MPIIQSNYQAPNFLFRNRHFSTLFPSIFRKVKGITYQRERLELPDGDFLDLDWSEGLRNEPLNPHSAIQTPQSKIAIFTHGLLGDSKRGYLMGCVKVFNEAGWEAVAWNHRGLSGEPNRLERMTIHGSSDELEMVVNHVIAKGYQHIALVGFSKGGNISLKYAGEQGDKIPPQIKSVVAISAPCDVYDSVLAMGEKGFYSNVFRDKLKKFIKSRTHLIAPEKLEAMKNYKTLDDYTGNYVAPLHGYQDAVDYYKSVSCYPVLYNIKVHSLLLNAENDPVLSEKCAAKNIAQQSDYLYVETPKHGGHCGFYEPNTNGIYWIDRRVLAFVEGEISM
jgi:uncharacterized protein